MVQHKTIDSVLERGEKLDSLVDKSSDLSMASQMFYKQAKKQNQCCKVRASIYRCALLRSGYMVEARYLGNLLPCSESSRTHLQMM